MSTPEAITGFLVVAPSTVGVGERFRLGIKVLTQPYVVGADCYGPTPSPVGRYNTSPRGIRYMDNVPPQWPGTVTLDGGEGFEGPTSLCFAEGRPACAHDRRPIRQVEGLCYRTPGIHAVTVTDPSTGLVGRSNPIEVTAAAPAERLWWADLHCQTFFTDGLRCPEELHVFAREEAFLDVFAISDHAEWLTDRQWEYFMAVANDFNAPGRFATLVALEWTSRRWGHRNAYFPGDAGPIWRANDPVMGDLPNLYRAARAHGALLVPHHSANVEMGVDWTAGHDPEVERLVEIHSVWGNSERPAAAGNPFPIRVLGGEQPGRHVIDALNRGYRLGLVGGGDIHDGRPGDELHNLQTEPAMYASLWRQGLTGLWARELSRSAVFEALWNRRVFATTNARILLRFSVAGQPMGAGVTAESPVPVHVFAVGTAPLARVDLVRDGEDVRTIRPHDWTLDWHLADRVPAAGAYYYVRLLQVDGHMAWSSPVWVSRR